LLNDFENVKGFAVEMLVNWQGKIIQMLWVDLPPNTGLVAVGSCLWANMQPISWPG